MKDPGQLFFLFVDGTDLFHLFFKYFISDLLSPEQVHQFLGSFFSILLNFSGLTSVVTPERKKTDGPFLPTLQFIHQGATV